MSRLIFVNRFYAPDHSATSQILTDLCRQLAAEGRDVTVIASAMRYDDPKAVLPREEVLDGVQVRRVATTRFGRGNVVGRLLDYLSFYVGTTLLLARVVRRGDVLVAKTDPPLISVPAALVARIKGARLVNWLQDLYPEVAVAMGIGALRGPVGAVARGLRDWSLRGAERNVAIGDIMAERLAALGVEAKRIAVIPNWSGDSDIAPVAAEANPLRAEWGYGADAFVVAYSGNLGRAHEVETLLDAARRLADRPDIRFLFIGGGHHQAMLAERASADGIASIAFRPYQPRAQLAQSLSVGDVHWLSLRPEFEGLIVPSKAFGIAAAARPILAVTDLDGEIARMVRTHDCGLAVAPGNGTGLAVAIAELADDRARCIAMGQRARAMLDAGFTQAHGFARFRALFAEILEGGSTVSGADGRDEASH